VYLPSFCPRYLIVTRTSLQHDSSTHSEYHAVPHHVLVQVRVEKDPGCLHRSLLTFVFLSLIILVSFWQYTLYYLSFIMESRVISRRPSAQIAGASSRHTPQIAEEEVAQQAQGSANSSLLDPRAQLTIERFLQDLPNAELPPQEFPPQYHTGRVPNSKAGDGKPRLLLMGQRR
jgi:hypothetical protein